VYPFDDWFDPIEAGVRDRVRGFIQAMIEGELDERLMRPRYGRRLASSSGNDDGLAGITGHRHGHRSRSLTGTFGPTEIAVPRARLVSTDGKTTEWKSKVLRTFSAVRWLPARAARLLERDKCCAKSRRGLSGV
jgi:putative transposase